MTDFRLLQRIKSRLPELQAEAAALDQSVEFPHAAMAALTLDGLLTATLPENLGGAGFGEGSAGAQALFELLYRLGQANLAVARIFEAHLNALQLILRYGTAGQVNAAAADAAAGHLFGLWVTDPLPAGVRLDGNMVLHGGKAFCSAAGVATRALITAATPAGAQMLVVSLAPNSRVQPSHVKLSGLRAAITGSVDFSGMEILPTDILGVPEDYLREPVFSAGAWRGSAAALGALRSLLDIHRAEICQRGRDGDPQQRARFGQMVIAHETCRLWMQQAARRACLEDAGNDAITAYINLARIAVETSCLDAMRHTQRSLGLPAFMAAHQAERICRDLATYLRQPAPDETLDKAAAHFFHAALPGDL